MELIGELMKNRIISGTNHLIVWTIWGIMRGAMLTTKIHAWCISFVVMTLDWFIVKDENGMPYGVNILKNQCKCGEKHDNSRGA
jgi:hypothetical protein